MSDFGHVLGGLAQGIGAGLVAKGQAEAASQAEDAKFRRELALKSMDHANRIDEDTHQSDLAANRDRANAGYRVAEATVQANLQDRNDERHSARATKSQIAVDAAKTQNDLVLARVQSSLRMTEEQSKQAQQLANDLAVAGQTMGDIRVAADGSIWAYSKTGKALGHSKAGKFTPPAVPGGNLDASALLGGGGNAPAPAPGSPVTTSNW